MQVLAVVAGSFLGTLLAGLVKGRTLTHMFTERLAGVTITMGLGIGFGCVVVAGMLLRERHARDQARILRAESERHRLEKSVLEARLQLMQAQVEPHFLFNTLANVQHLVETDAPAASRVLSSLIHYLRAALPQMREGATNLGREIDMARAFLEIHKRAHGLAARVRHRGARSPQGPRLPADDADLAGGERHQARRGPVLRMRARRDPRRRRWTGACACPWPTRARASRPRRAAAWGSPTSANG